MANVTLITGGCRSGKSAHALALARRNGASNRRFFLATAQGLDAEMQARIEHHRAARGADFQTVEEPIDLSSALALLQGRADVLVLDCLTLWVSNLLGAGLDDSAIMAAADALAHGLGQACFDSVVVTDEVGSGVVPDNELARRFRDLLGWTNQKIGNAADEIVLMVSGHPLRVK